MIRNLPEILASEILAGYLTSAIWRLRKATMDGDPSCIRAAQGAVDELRQAISEALKDERRTIH